MWWRLRRKEVMASWGEGNHRAMREIVESGSVPGILAYLEGEPVGWISVEPRDEFPTLDRSRVLARVDDQPVWSIVCFFVDKRFRGKGLSVELIRAAVNHAGERGAKIIEAYPVEPEKMISAPWAWTGLASAFARAGFKEVARRSRKRPIMRYYI